MSSDNNESGQANVNPKDAGVEENVHMTNDGAPGSHSELFGLGAKDAKGGSQKDSNREPGDKVAEPDMDTSGGGSEPTPAQPTGKTGPMSDGSTDNAPAGAGTTMTTAEQGSGKVNPDKESVMDKVNPFK